MSRFHDAAHEAPGLKTPCSTDPCCFRLSCGCSPSLWRGRPSPTPGRPAPRVPRSRPTSQCGCPAIPPRTKPAEGTLHDLWAKALVAGRPDGQRVVLVTLDLVGIARDLSVAVCAELKKKHGLPRESILLSVSHTHTGPVVGSNLNAMYSLDEGQQKLVAAYARDLQAKLVEVVSTALSNLAPAQLAWGIGHGDLRRQPPQQQGARRSEAARDGAAERAGRSRCAGAVGARRQRRGARGRLRLCLPRHGAGVLPVVRRLSRASLSSPWKRPIRTPSPCSGPAAAPTRTHCRGAAVPWPRNTASSSPRASSRSSTLR